MGLGCGSDIVVHEDIVGLGVRLTIRVRVRSRVRVRAAMSYVHVDRANSSEIRPWLRVSVGVCVRNENRRVRAAVKEVHIYGKHRGQG